jgi:hypothetical protein
MILKEGHIVRFNREWYHPISNYEEEIAAGETGTVTEVSQSLIVIRLDTYHGELDEWDNSLQFSPEVYGSGPERSGVKDVLLMLEDMAKCIEVVGTRWPIPRPLTRDQIEAYKHNAERDKRHCPYCSAEAIRRLDPTNPNILSEGIQFDCLACQRRWLERIQVTDIEEVIRD